MVSSSPESISTWHSEKGNSVPDRLTVCNWPWTPGVSGAWTSAMRDGGGLGDGITGSGVVARSGELNPWV